MITAAIYKKHEREVCATSSRRPAQEHIWFTAFVGIWKLGAVGAAEVGVGVLDPAVGAVDGAVPLPLEARSLRALLSSLGSNLRLNKVCLSSNWVF